MKYLCEEIAAGKTAWSLEELSSDPTVESRLKQAEHEGLISGLKFGSRSKGLDSRHWDVPFQALVTGGLTSKGRALTCKK